MRSHITTGVMPTDEAEVSKQTDASNRKEPNRSVPTQREGTSNRRESESRDESKVSVERLSGCGVEGGESREELRGELRGEKHGQQHATLSARWDGPTHDLKLDSLALEVNGADLEVDTNGRDVALGVRVVGESEKQTRLADTRVTDEKELCKGQQSVWSARRQRDDLARAANRERTDHLCAVLLPRLSCAAASVVAFLGSLFHRRQTPPTHLEEVVVLGSSSHYGQCLEGCWMDVCVGESPSEVDTSARVCVTQGGPGLEARQRSEVKPAGARQQAQDDEAARVADSGQQRCNARDVPRRGGTLQQGRWREGWSERVGWQGGRSGVWM